MIEVGFIEIIPVVGVVVCALLVYIFGFQKTQEPSFQHLAVLQSTNKGSRTSNSKQRSSTPKVNSSLAKTSNKSSVANGHANVQASPKPNGTVKTASAKVKEPSNNKENVRPQQQKPVKKEKAVRDTAEDLESGDWIQAPSRKDKKAKKEVVVPKSPEKSKLGSNNSSSLIDEVAKPTVTTPQAEPEQEQQQVVKKEVEPEVVQSLPKEPALTPKKAKENKKKSPKVEKSSTRAIEKEEEEEEEVAAAKVVVPAKIVKEVRQEKAAPTTPTAIKENATLPASPVKETPPSKNEEPKAVDPKNNIAFDEMGDAWEEAKSRGTKKRRARKD